MPTTQSLPQTSDETLKLMGSDDLANLLLTARVKAGLTRVETQNLFGVSADQWVRTESAERDSDLVRSWISQLERLHTGIAIDENLVQSPAVIRELRIGARLTKAEASEIVGVSPGSAWHFYETGRMLMIPQRWDTFKTALNTGGFRSFYSGPYRRGPRENSYFEPGKMHVERVVKLAVGSEIILLARHAMRIQADNMASVVGMSTAQVYGAENGRITITIAMLNSVKRALQERRLELKSFVAVANNAKTLSKSVEVVRLTRDEVGTGLYPDSARPGTNVYNLMRKTTQFSAYTELKLVQTISAFQSNSLSEIDSCLVQLENVLDSALVETTK